MELIKGEKTSELVGDFGDLAHQLFAQLEGRKRFVSPKRLVFESSEHNFRTLRALAPSSLPAAVEASPDCSVSTGGATPLRQWRLEPRDYQLDSFEKLKALHAVALFSEPGTGKTKTIIDIICYRWLLGQLTGVLILSSPKGVHAQWVTEQLPQHMWFNVPYEAQYSKGKLRPTFPLARVDQLQIYSTNIDALNSDRNFGMLQTFCSSHQGKLMIVIDESASIKTWSAKRSKRLRLLASQYFCRQRVIMTGTPIAKDLTDEWSQFYFLDPNIIGHKYKTSFRAQFCVMGGFEDRIVVGYKNLDLFKKLTAPYIFRAYKSELNLPEKIYDTIEFDLSDEQRHLIRDIRETLSAELDGARISAAHAATALLRIQQISNGFTVAQGIEETAISLRENPRMDALRQLISHLSGKVIIWCRFRMDVAKVLANLPGNAVGIYGGTEEKARIQHKELFIKSPDVRFLVATPDTAGQGLDGLQNVCENAIYYSNSYNAIARWQSEDRIHRLGMRGAASYYDLVARGSIDRAVLRNLRNKKSLSTLVLDDMKELIKEIGE